MKHTKRFFALLLALALVLGTGVFAAAEEVTADGLTNQPQTITYGKDIVVSAEGLLPESLQDWEVSYRWSIWGDDMRVIEHATGPVLHLTRKDAEYPDGEKFLGVLLRPVQGIYFCEVIVRNADGEERIPALLYASVIAKPTRLGRFIAAVIDTFNWVGRPF